MARFGEQTRLAMQNFTVSGESFPLPVIHALALIKAEAASANFALGALTLEPDVFRAIVEAAEEIAAGKFDDEFRIDVFQTGSGTSSNMNVNEVIAALVAERRPGTNVHPNEHVNASQSSNDVVPSAVHLAVGRRVDGELVPALVHLAATLRDVAHQHRNTVKTGRTHLMDAVPVTLGQELGGMARAVELGAERLRSALQRLLELPLGGTATGTGLNAPPGFAALVISALAERTGLPWVEALDHFEAQGGRDALVEMSAMCRSVAVSMFKIANDLRWMASGPVAGLGEIRLPALQAGSSIMPGKVNPVIPEVVCQVAAQVIGNDAAVAFAGASGSFELNVMIPVIARNVLASVHLLTGAARSLADRCIGGIAPDIESMQQLVERSPMLATALNDLVGYDAAKDVVEQSLRTGESIQSVVVRLGLLDAADAKTRLGVLRLARPDDAKRDV